STGAWDSSFASDTEPSGLALRPSDSGVRDIAPVAPADGEIRLEGEACRRIERNGVRPVERADSLGDEPGALPSLEAIDVAKPQDHVAVPGHMVGDAVGVTVRDVALHPDGGRSDEVHRRLEMRQHGAHPGR